MPTPLWVAAGISALALAGGSAVAVVVIANSGPLSHGQSESIHINRTGHSHTATIDDISRDRHVRLQ